MSKTILLAEDEDHDVLFMRFAMEWAKVLNPLQVVRDGREAIAYLEGRGKYADRKLFPVPGLVLLDLKMPKVNGLEVLRRLRQLPEMASVPVIVFSSSNQEADVEASYAMGANGYIVKPAYTELLQVVSRIKQFWLDMDGPPPDCREWLAVTEPRTRPSQ